MKLKVRIWDKVDKKMIYLDQVIDTEHHVLSVGKDGVLEYQNYQNGAGGEETEIMLSTGLNDKYGREIYVGDILFNSTSFNQPRGTLHHSITAEVTTLKGMTYLVGKCENGFIEEEIFTSDYKALLLTPELFGITGNIYENPELLGDD